MITVLACHAAAREEPVEGSADTAQPAMPRGCPSEMLRVDGCCIDRWEATLVDHESSQPLSPYYPAEPRLLRAAYGFWQLERLNTGEDGPRAMPLPELPEIQRSGRFRARAVSVPGVVPQGYLSYYQAKSACELAGKRLCTKDEWLKACRGQRGTKFPYGNLYQPDHCNVYRLFHPAFVLHGNASTGHRDPRLNLLVEAGVGPLLRLTGATDTCASPWGDDAVYDMVGNLDEWIEDENGTFLGGFYARSTRKGCDASVTEHAPAYYDYSLGTRCCSSALTGPGAETCERGMAAQARAG